MGKVITSKREALEFVRSLFPGNDPSGVVAEEATKKTPAEDPRCEVCGGLSSVWGQSILHPKPRHYCRSCFRDEVAACQAVREVNGG